MDNQLIHLLGFKVDKHLSKKELIILEILIYTHIYHELEFYFDKDNVRENTMINGSLIRKLANDLIISEEYSIPGIAQYTGFPEEAIYDLLSGINYSPTVGLANKIIELHITARRELYLSFLKDIIRFNQVSLHESKV